MFLGLTFETLETLPEHWLWGLMGVCVGIGLNQLSRFLPHQILKRANEPLELWRGPGGGLNSPTPKRRIFWVPFLNGFFWMLLGANTAQANIWVTLAWCSVASCLLLLAIIDWDTTLLPDWLVLPLALAGLTASWAGWTLHSFIASFASALFIVLLLSSLSWAYKRFRGLDGLGGGDIKLLGALATWWGATHTLYVVVLACIITLLWYAAMRALHQINDQDEWPFGPSIVLAALLLWH